MALLDRHDLVILDLDGVVYIGADAVPGALDALPPRLPTEVPVLYATNNASRPAVMVARHLRALGLELSDDDVVTSAQAAAHYLAGVLSPGSPVLAIGGPGVAESLEARGLRAVATADAAPMAVCQGYGPDVSWRDLAEAARAIQRGAIWVATNTDATIPTTHGIAPGNGSLVAAVRTAVDVDPVVAGKPEPLLFSVCAQRVAAHRPLVVGDRLDTDIEGANRSGFNSLLVLTGVTNALSLAQAPPQQRPTWISDNLAGLHRGQPSIEIDGEVHRCRDARARRVGVIVECAGSDARSADAVRAICSAAWTQKAPIDAIEPKVRASF